MSGYPPSKARHIVTALLAALAVSSFACTPSQDDPASKRAAPPPRRGGSLVFGVVGAPATLDPYSPVASDLTRALARPLYPSLFRLRPDGSTRPDLAASFQRSASGARVLLRKVRWSSGRVITAGDVVASARRARAPSGFAAFTQVRRVGRFAVTFRGEGVAFRRALASMAYVLPRGRAGEAFGGPYRVRRYRPGLELVLERNRLWREVARDGGEPPRPLEPFLDRVTVRFVETLRQLVGLLEQGRLDAAAPPSLVNLDEILGPRIRLARAVGWESVFLDFHGSPLEASERAAIARGIDRVALKEAFVRDAGRVIDQLPAALGGGTARALPLPRPPSRRVQIAVPAGDELLELMQEAIFGQLGAAHIEADLVGVDQTTFYGAWRRSNPTDAALRRGVGGPSFASENERDRGMRAYPLFRVASFVAVRPGVHGPLPNPTFEGPLWNLERWWRSAPDGG